MNSFTQNYRGHRTKFSFGEHSLAYEHSDAEDSIVFEVSYTGIDAHSTIKARSKNPILKFASFPFMFLAVFAIGKASLIADDIEKLLVGLFVAAIWLVVAGVFWWRYKRSEVTLTMFDSVRGRLVIIHDGQEVQIINMLTKLTALHQSEFKQAESSAIQ